jgi:hypothetical protein
MADGSGGGFRFKLLDVGKSLPTPSDLHVNSALSNVAIAFKQDATRFAAGKVIPEVDVDKQSDTYFIWDRADFFRDEAEEAGPNDEAPVMNQRVSTDTYFCKKHHIAGVVSEEDLTNADPAVNKDVAITNAIMNKLLIKREKQFINTFFKTGVWTGGKTLLGAAADLVGGTDFVQFDNYAGSDPVQTIRAQVFQLSLLGIDPMNLKLTMGPLVYQVLLDHPKFIERYEHTMPSIMTQALMAGVLGIGEVVVPFASEATSIEGAATTVMEYTWGKHMLLSYSPKAASKEEPSCGYHFRWKGLLGSPAEGIRISRWWERKPRQWYILGEMSYGPKLTSSVLGAFFQNAVA